MTTLAARAAVGTHKTRRRGLRPVDEINRLRAAPFHAGLTGDALPVTPDTWPAPPGPWPMDKNDRWGDCVVAMVDHALTAIAEYFGTPRTSWSTGEILELYRTQNPTFNPDGNTKTNGPGSTADGGMNIQTFLEHLVTRGDITAFGKVDHTNLAELNAATYIGLAVATGVVVDDPQMDAQFDAGTWDYVPDAPEDGGHAIPLVARQLCITWAKPVALTDAFIGHQMTEAWFILTPAHIAHPGFRNTYDLAAFAAAVKTVTRGKVIVPVPPTPPGPSPMPVPGPDAASFPVAADLVDHIAAASHRAHLTPAAWLDHVLRVRFHMPAQLHDLVGAGLVKPCGVPTRIAGARFGEDDCHLHPGHTGDCLTHEQWRAQLGAVYRPMEPNPPVADGK